MPKYPIKVKIVWFQLDIFSNELSFAYTFEVLLNEYEDPVYKHMAVEFFSVLSKIMKRHPEVYFIGSLNVDDMLEQAMKLYAEVCIVPEI